MNRFFTLLFLVVLFLTSISTAFAQESNETDLTTESWYTYWGLGYANVSYPADIQVWIDLLKDQPEVSTMSISLDILGFYWHIAPKTIAGFIINGVGDRFEVSGESMQINQYLYAGSVIHYPGQSFGSGFFLRADIGLAKLAVTSSFGEAAGSESGFGLLGGGGWSFDLNGTRLLLNVNYAYRGVESETYNTLSFSVGGLF